MLQKLKKEFFQQDVLVIAPQLLGKLLIRRFENGEVKSFKIREVEAYNGEFDLACHASKGKTSRTQIMYKEGGHVYMYLIYGMHWMLNIVTGVKQHPQAVLIRGVEGASGPGRVGKLLQLDRTFYGEQLWNSKRIWVEDAPEILDFKTSPRINVDYAGEPWVSKLWRYYLEH